MAVARWSSTLMVPHRHKPQQCLNISKLMYTCLQTSLTSSPTPNAIASIVQSFIETVGVPTVMRWRRAAMNNNWLLTQSGNLPGPSNNNLPTVPNPVTPSSSYYIFPGRLHGSLQTASQLPPSGSHTSSLHSQLRGLQGSQTQSQRMRQTEMGMEIGIL
jgi:hypothetical protein